MYPLDAQVVAALSQTHKAKIKATAYYGADVTLASVPLTEDGYLRFNGDSQIQSSGVLYLARDVARKTPTNAASRVTVAGGIRIPGVGESLVPRTQTDVLAPFGQEIGIWYVFAVAGVEYSIPLGRYRITEVPNAREYFRRFPSRVAAVAWECQLGIADRFDQIIADDFLQATGPVAGNSTWDEIRRLSPIPVVESLTDVALPVGISYDSRIGAIETLMNNLGGVPHMTRDGALTCRQRDTWLTSTSPVFTINGVIEMSGGMSNQLYNQVVVRSSTGTSQEIVAVRKITDESNPMAVTRAGGRTYSWSSPLITTQAAADAAAVTILARVSSRQARIVTVTCLPRPDIELGDFGVATDSFSGRTVSGEVTAMNFSMDPTDTMTIELIVAEDIS